MDPMHMLADTVVRRRMAQQFHIPEIRHMAAARRPSHRRYVNQVRRLKALAFGRVADAAVA